MAQSGYCKYYGSAAGCRTGITCKFSHDNPNSIALCSNFNPCRYGDKCQFRHTVYDDQANHIIHSTQNHHTSNNNESLSMQLNKNQALPTIILFDLLDALCYFDNLRPTINASYPILSYYDVLYIGDKIKYAKYQFNTKNKTISYSYKCPFNGKIKIFGNIKYENKKNAQKIATIHIIFKLFHILFKIDFDSVTFRGINDDNRINKYKLMNHNIDSIVVLPFNNSKISISSQLYTSTNSLHNIYIYLLKNIFYPICNQIRQHFIDRFNEINLTLNDILLHNISKTIHRISNIFDIYGIKIDKKSFKIVSAKYLLNTPKTNMITYSFEYFSGGIKIKIYKVKEYSNYRKAIIVATLKMISKIFIKLFGIKFSDIRFKLIRDDDYKKRYKCCTLNLNDNNMLNITFKNNISNQILGYKQDISLPQKNIKKEIYQQIFNNICDLIQINFDLNNINSINAKKRKYNMIDLTLTDDDDIIKDEFDNNNNYNTIRQPKRRRLNDNNSIY